VKCTIPGSANGSTESVFRSLLRLLHFHIQFAVRTDEKIDESEVRETDDLKAMWTFHLQNAAASIGCWFLVHANAPVLSAGRKSGDRGTTLAEMRIFYDCATMMPMNDTTPEILTSWTAFQHLMKEGVNVVSCEDNGPRRKVIELGDGRRITAETFEDAIQQNQ
jgi:hypothetical protein